MPAVWHDKSLEPNMGLIRVCGGIILQHGADKAGGLVGRLY